MSIAQGGARHRRRALAGLATDLCLGAFFPPSTSFQLATRCDLDRRFRLTSVAQCSVECERTLAPLVLTRAWGIRPLPPYFVQRPG